MSIEAIEARLKTLENQVSTLRDIEEIKKLQRAYGYYLEHWMVEEIVDCFSDDPDVALILYVGTFLQKQGVRRFFDTFFSEEEKVSPELLHLVMQLSGIVDVETDGKTAKGRWYGWGMTAIPSGEGITQAYMSGI